jgi:FtsP/CotA-like multicopper oxidase with cupredoxin domain
MTNASSLHWHGMYQNGTNWMDGTVGVTQCSIPANTSFTYNFTVPNQYGTYWYHAHAGTQYNDGIVGPLIIHAPEEAQAQEMYDHDQVIMVQDYYHDLSAALLPGYFSSGNENTEPSPDNGLVQGTGYFNCSSYDADSGYSCSNDSSRQVFSVAQGQRYRLRFINSGAMGEFQVSVDNHTLTVIEADGTMLEPAEVHRFEIAVAQRYSVILNANQTVDNYWMRVTMNPFCFNPSDVLDPAVTAIISYDNTTTLPNSVDWTDATDVACKDFNSSLLVPLVKQDAPPADQAFGLGVSFQIGAYAIDRAYINGTTWTPAKVPTLNQAVTGLSAGNDTFTASGVSQAYDTSSQYVIDISEYSVVDVLINNFDEGAHPFHLHGHTFYIMADSAVGYFDWSTYGSLNTTNPMRRDTIVIQAYGWALIRFVTDNPGLWAFHCHISWHMEAGLLMQFQAGNDVMKNWTIPSDVLGLCPS